MNSVPAMTTRFVGACAALISIAIAVIFHCAGLDDLAQDAGTLAFLSALVACITLGEIPAYVRELRDSRIRPIGASVALLACACAIVAHASGEGDMAETIGNVVFFVAAMAAAVPPRSTREVR